MRRIQWDYRVVLTCRKWRLRRSIVRSLTMYLKRSLWKSSQTLQLPIKNSKRNSSNKSIDLFQPELLSRNSDDNPNKKSPKKRLCQIIISRSSSIRFQRRNLNSKAFWQITQAVCRKNSKSCKRIVKAQYQILSQLSNNQRNSKSFQLSLTNESNQSKLKSKKNWNAMIQSLKKDMKVFNLLINSARESQKCGNELESQKKTKMFSWQITLTIHMRILSNSNFIYNCYLLIGNKQKK